MAKRASREQRQDVTPNDEEHLKESKELLSLIRQKMSQRRSGPAHEQPKDLEIPEPD